jgi:hypothetical protein
MYLQHNGMDVGVCLLFVPIEENRVAIWKDSYDMNVISY